MSESDTDKLFDEMEDFYIGYGLLVSIHLANLDRLQVSDETKELALTQMQEKSNVYSRWEP